MPAMWVRDETYSREVEVRAGKRETQTGQRVSYAQFDAQRRGEARPRHRRRNEVTKEQTPQDANEATIGAVASTAGLGAWLPIETAPINGTAYDIWADGQRYTNMIRGGDGSHHPAGGGTFIYRSHRVFRATHWMPLPDAPNAI